ncbi:MAG: pallilysin-related adhesin, partial [Spirochaetaceae bacterium]|nr:pallilysin-related adhesin [Spirochaetaceae bacterium]
QIIAYRKLLEIESPIYITYIDFDHGTNQYRRVWDTITAANRPGTVNIYTQDMIGDRSICVLITGMNGAGEHTLTIFKKNPAPGNTGNSPLGYQPFNKIAEIRIDGAISVQERERSQAYQLGQTRGQSFTIAAYSRDYESPNILDQVEIIYAYNSVNGLYEQSRITRIPGTQIEQRRVRELLSAGPEEFERFIEGLWYYVGPQGTLDSRQYIYFDPKNREIIFYTDDVQQIYDWKNSSPTRYGLYVASQNISITNLRRFLNIELESLDSVQVKVFEDVHLRINVSAPWDGSYRKAKMIQSAGAPDSGSISPRFNAVYDGAIGTIAFDKNGTYELSASGITRKGKYTFFIVDNQQLLELRKDDPPDGSARETFRVESSNPASGNIYKNITLTRVRLGTKGIQELHEAAIALALVDGIGDGS